LRSAHWTSTYDVAVIAPNDDATATVAVNDDATAINAAIAWVLATTWIELLITQTAFISIYFEEISLLLYSTSPVTSIFIHFSLLGSMFFSRY
jgi:hypothetical protein